MQSKAMQASKQARAGQNIIAVGFSRRGESINKIWGFSPEICAGRERQGNTGQDLLSYLFRQQSHSQLK